MDTGSNCIIENIRIEQLEEKIYKLESTILRLKAHIHHLQNDPKKPDIDRLLGDEEYRLEYALSISETNQEAADRLNLNVRTIYRILKRAQ